MKIWKIAQHTTHPTNFITMREMVENMEREREGNHANYSTQELQKEIELLQLYREVNKTLLESSSDRKNREEIAWHQSEISKYSDIILRILPILEEKKLDDIEINSLPRGEG